MNQIDYTTYPEGMKALAAKLDLPSDDPAVREKLVLALAGIMINN